MDFRRPHCHLHCGIGGVEFGLLEERDQLWALVCTVYTLGPNDPGLEPISRNRGVAEHGEGALSCSRSLGQVVFGEAQHESGPCCARESQTRVTQQKYFGMHP